MTTTGKIVAVNGNMITVAFDGAVAQNEVGYAVLGDKLGVGAALGYFAVLDDEDLIGILYRCKTVGDGD